LTNLQAAATSMAMNLTRVILILILILLGGIGCQSIKDKEEAVTITDTNGVILFDKQGEIFMSTHMAHWIIKLELPELDRAFESFRSRILKQDMDKTKETPPFRDMNDVYRRYEDTKSLLAKEEGDRIRDDRNILGWVGGLLGLFNTFRIHEITSKQTHEDEAIRATVQEVDAIKDFSKTNDVNIEKMEKKIQEMEQDRFNILRATDREIVQGAAWRSIKRRMEAVTDLGQQAVHHLLSPKLDRLVDMRVKWNNFTSALKNQGWEPALDNFQSLFQRKIDVHFDGVILRLVLHVPIKQPEKKGYKRLIFQNKPFVMAGHITKVVTLDRILALQVESGAYFTMNDNEMNRCEKVRDNYFCKDAYVAFSKPGLTCLDALWTGLWGKVGQHCPLEHQPESTQAWSVTGNRFVALTTEETVMTVTCTGQEQLVKKIAGMQLVWIRRDCVASLPDLVMIPGSDSVTSSNSFEADVNLTSALYSTETKTDIKKLTLAHPASVQSVKNRVEAELRAGAWTTPEKIILGISLAIVLAIIVGLAGLYFRARFMAIPLPPVPDPEQTPEQT
jgi:hypothetical protein